MENHATKNIYQNVQVGLCSGTSVGHLGAPLMDLPRPSHGPPTAPYLVSALGPNRAKLFRGKEADSVGYTTSGVRCTGTPKCSC